MKLTHEKGRGKKSLHFVTAVNKMLCNRICVFGIRLRAYQNVQCLK